MGGHELAANVNVAGTWYGPAHPAAVVTDDVARQISNPKAWPDRQLPDLPDLPDPAAPDPAEDGDGTGDGTGDGAGDGGTGEGATSQRPGRSRSSRRGDGT